MRTLEIRGNEAAIVFVRLNSKCLMFWRDLKVPLALPAMTLDYLCSEEDNSKNRKKSMKWPYAIRQRI